MAVQVSGTEVISNARALNNITSVDSTTAAAINATGLNSNQDITAVINSAVSQYDPLFRNLSTNNLVSFADASGPNPSGVTQPVNSSSLSTQYGYIHAYNSQDDVLFILGMQSNTLKVMKFGTNNKLSTFTNGGVITESWLVGGSPASARAALLAYCGNGVFCVLTEVYGGPGNVGTYAKTFKWDGTTSEPVAFGGWAQVYYDQSQPMVMVSDSLYPQNLVWTSNYRNDGYPWGMQMQPIQVNTSTGGITWGTMSSVMSDSTTGDMCGLQYCNGDVVGDAQQGASGNLLAWHAKINTSNGTSWISGQNENTTYITGYNSGANFTFKSAVLNNNTWAYLHSPSASLGTSGYSLSRLTFPQNGTVTLNNTVDTAVYVGSLRVIPLANRGVPVDSFFLATEAKDQVWKWTGSSFSKTYEATGANTCHEKWNINGHWATWGYNYTRGRFADYVDGYAIVGKNAGAYEISSYNPIAGFSATDNMFAGISQGNYSSGQTATIRLRGTTAISGGSFVAGKTYEYTSGGISAATGDLSANVLLGKATSSSAVYVGAI